MDAEEAEKYLGERVGVVVDGGRVKGGVPSTVVDCTGEMPVILRVGAISEQRIRQVWEATEMTSGK